MIIWFQYKPLAVLRTPSLGPVLALTFQSHPVCPSIMKTKSLASGVRFNSALSLNLSEYYTTRQGELLVKQVNFNQDDISESRRIMLQQSVQNRRTEMTRLGVEAPNQLTPSCTIRHWKL